MNFDNQSKWMNAFELYKNWRKYEMNDLKKELELIKGS